MYSSNSLGPKSGVHWGDALSTVSSRGELHATHSAALQPFYLYDGAYSSEALTKSHVIPLSSLIAGEGSFFRLCSPQWQSQLQICCGCYTWWFWCGNRASVCWIYWHLVNRVLCCSVTHLLWCHGQGVNTNLLFLLEPVVRFTPFGPDSWRLWAWSWFYPLSLCEDTRTGCFLS